MSWKAGVVLGIGPCVFELVRDDGSDIVIRRIAIPQQVQTDRGPQAALVPWMFEMGAMQGELRVRRESLLLVSEANEETVAACERAWGLRQLDIPTNRLVVPGGNGPR